MTSRLATLASAVLIVASSRAPAQSPPDTTSPVLDAMKVELARSLTALRSSPTPPYFLGYDITEERVVTVTASFGAITDRSDERRRALDVQLRVGSYAFDNTHAVRGDFPDFGMLFDSPVDIPIDNDPMAIRAALWYETQQRYRDAVEALSHARTNAGLRVAPEDSSPDFSRESPERYVEAPESLVVDRAAWEAKLRRYTAPFAQQRDIYGANAFFNATVETHWYVNSEGTTIQTSQPGYRLYIAAFSKADDGMELPRYESFYAATPAGLPDDQTVLRAVDRMITDLQALRRAPSIDPYTGPAILSGRASAVFFHEILGHRLEGHRQKNEAEGQTFAHHIAEAVLPAGFSVYFDPTLRKLGSTDLAGYYRYDDEGVKARRVGVIERGVLKTFLMSRMPIQGFANSNGHGRRQVGFSPVARQSNLIVQVAAPKTRAQLKQQLIDQIRQQRKPYGLFFDDIEGGFTITQRGIPNAFEVLPIMVYRVFPDGREELVRGVDLIGTPLTVFSKITAGDDQVAVFNGMCGAESGYVPVSAVSPGILISQIEIQKKPKSSERPPILPPPPVTSGGSDTGNVVLRAMRDELARSMAELHLDTMPRPYFLSYRIDDATHLGASASRGSLIGSGESRNRRLTVELRIGDYAFDNTNYVGMSDDMSDFIGEFGGGMGELPLDDDYAALRRELWLATDGSYKSAVADLAQKRAVLANRTRRTDLPDFSREDPVTITDTVPAPRLDRGAVEDVVRGASAAFINAPDIYQSEVTWSGGFVRTWYVNSEGTSSTRLVPWGAVHARASTQATDGLPLDDGIAEYAATPDALPGREALTRTVQEFATRVAKLRSTPPAETYNGPVLFEGRAAAELFASALASEFSADRLPITDNDMFSRMRDEGLVDQIGSRILPRSFSVTEDPTVREFDGKFIGGALVDDEGVRTRATKLVDRGVLKTLLTTRVPVTGIPRSSGSRRGGGPAITNLFVTTDSGLTDAQLRKRAVALAAQQGTSGYVIVVRRIGRGAGARGLMAGMRAGMGGGGGAIAIADAVKLFPDGREEPIRGATLAGVTEASFKDIAAASRSRTALTLPARVGMRGMFMMLGAMRRSSFMGMGAGQSATYVVPSLLFDELSIRKPTGDGIAPPAFSPPWVENSRE
ncbi:MAG TPA: metallopeptidase TldD-related protein [Gemmatimonadales bacterium]|nr:metallopeptidase TldD-related protein [Gemmatimonadales bacterium]